MRANQASYPVATMCHVLGVSTTSGYYAWLTRPPSRRAQEDAVLLERIRAIYARSRGTYGAPRLHAELRAEGIRVGCKRLARLMRTAGLEGVSRPKRAGTTRRDREARPAPDLVEREFAVPGPDELWMADITYVPTGGGVLVPLGGPGRLEPPGGGLGHGDPSPDGARPGGPPALWYVEWLMPNLIPQPSRGNRTTGATASSTSCSRSLGVARRRGIGRQQPYLKAT